MTFQASTPPEPDARASVPEQTTTADETEGPGFLVRLGTQFGAAVSTRTFYGEPIERDARWRPG